eukprot:3936185-Rhodomonas_salina.1
MAIASSMAISCALVSVCCGSDSSLASTASCQSIVRADRASVPMRCVGDVVLWSGSVPDVSGSVVSRMSWSATASMGVSVVVVQVQGAGQAEGVESVVKFASDFVVCAIACSLCAVIGGSVHVSVNEECRVVSSGFGHGSSLPAFPFRVIPSCFVYGSMPLWMIVATEWKLYAASVFDLQLVKTLYLGHKA